MYRVEIETVDYTTGQRAVRVLPRNYKTEKGAITAARRMAVVVRPGGGAIASETFARVKAWS